MDKELADLVEAALEEGFTLACELNTKALEFLPEVRDMCKDNRCGKYGKNWMCPPYCGTVFESAQRASKFSKGILVQTTGAMEDDFDYESMLGTGRRHKEMFESFAAKARARFPHALPMGAGACEMCCECSCPESPCRHPDKAISSMEAYGLMVNDVCEKSGVPYVHEKLTITYTSCVLVGLLQNGDGSQGDS
jgi:predicted metal-binding protein